MGGTTVLVLRFTWSWCLSGFNYRIFFNTVLVLFISKAWLLGMLETKEFEIMKQNFYYLYNITTKAVNDKAMVSREA